MPELPEVQTVVDSLRPTLLGRAVVATHLARADVLRPSGFRLGNALLGRTVADVRRRGKRIILDLDDGNRLHFHLGMTGRLTLHNGKEPLAKHTHLIIDLRAGGPKNSPQTQLRFGDPRRFGGVWWVDHSAAETADADIGPEPLTVSASELAARLARTRRAIKSALLDQRLLAGLGNIYVDESLYLAGIHPLVPACRLSTAEVDRLCSTIKRTLRDAIRHRGSTLRDFVDGDGSAGGYQRHHKVYGQAGEPCGRCGSAIQKIVLGGRSTHFCPSCQRARRKSPRTRQRGGIS